MIYDYLICGIRIRYDLPYTLKIKEESAPFLCEPSSETCDLYFKFTPVEMLAPPKFGGIWAINAKYYTVSNGYDAYYCLTPNSNPYCRVSWRQEQPDQMTCEYLRTEEHQVNYSRNLVELLGLEGFLLRFRGILLHSSLVRWQGKAILFSAPCGTGKSTQASLWEQYMGSETLNGDRAGIRFADGVWTAFGLPFAGTSGIYRNESAPVAAIVTLSQGSENVIRRLSPMEALKKLLPECSSRRWDQNYMDQLLNVLLELVQQVPVYRLECRPDQGAVELLHDTITKEKSS